MFKYLHQILKPYLDHYVFIGFIFAPLCILIPNDQGSILNPIRLGNDITIISSMKSIHLKYILIVVMSSSSILFLEVAVDNLFNLKNILASKGSLINLSILLVLLLSSAVSFFIALPYEDSDLMCRIFQIRNLVVCASVMSFSSRYGKTFWRDRILFVAYLFLCVGSLLRIASYSDSSVEQSSSSLIISTVGIIFQAFLSFLIIVYTIRWYIYLRKETFLRNITVDEWNTTLYMTMGSFTLIVLWVFNPLYGEKDYNDFSVAHLISIEVAFASFAVVQALYQTRSVRVESNKRKARKSALTLSLRAAQHADSIVRTVVLYEKLETAGKASRRFTGVYNAESMRSDGSSSRNSVQAFQSIRIASDGRENENSGKISHSTTTTTTPPRGSVLQSTPFSNLLRRMNSNSKVAVSPDNDNDDVLSTIESEPGEYVDSGNSSVHNMKSSNMAQRVELAFMEIELTEVGKDDGPCDKQTKDFENASYIEPELNRMRALPINLGSSAKCFQLMERFNEI
eukprot:gene5341-10685_t